MSAHAVGELYLWLSNQQPTLFWTRKLDMRPAQEMVPVYFLSIAAVSVARDVSRAEGATLLQIPLKTPVPLPEKVCSLRISYPFEEGTSVCVSNWAFRSASVSQI